jgi:hypothetical protein
MRKWIDLVENFLPVETVTVDQEIDESFAPTQGITDTIEEEIKNSELTAREINDGLCNEFADQIVNRMGGRSADTCAASPRSELELEQHGLTYDPTAPLHWFVIHHGRVYDAEAPEGRDRWQELPFFMRYVW